MQKTHFGWIAPPRIRAGHIFHLWGGKGGSLWKQITYQISQRREMTSKVGGYLSIQDVRGSVKTKFFEDGLFDFLDKIGMFTGQPSGAKYREGNDPELINKMQDPYFLDKIAQTFRDVYISIKNFGPWSNAWVGEGGGAFNNGGINVSNTFIDSFWYLDKLGMASAFDHKVYCRQSLVGGNYGLLDTTTFLPNPDYYSALLWSRLMGTEVLQTTINGSPYLRAYTHCSKNQNGVTMLLINLSNSTTFDVSVTGDLNLYPPQYTSSAAVEGKNVVVEGQREEYHLRPKDGNLKSRVMLLNGQPLTLTSTGDIPKLNSVSYSSDSTLKISPLSFAFVRLKDFIAPACQ